MVVTTTEKKTESNKGKYRMVKATSTTDFCNQIEDLENDGYVREDFKTTESIGRGTSFIALMKKK